MVGDIGGTSFVRHELSRCGFDAEVDKSVSKRSAELGDGGEY